MYIRKQLQSKTIRYYVRKDNYKKKLRIYKIGASNIYHAYVTYVYSFFSYYYNKIINVIVIIIIYII